MLSGVRIGHWSDPVGRTGCTVLIFPEGSVASGEVRGGAPGTREWALLDPTRMVSRIDAVVLAGGSAFGLAAADGVMRWCEENGLGFKTAGGIVPIVVGAVLYDLAQGEGKVRPGPEQGYAACIAARADESRSGLIGAGTGAMINKWRGAEHARPGGIGIASITEGEVTVAALIAVNAWGDVLDVSTPLPIAGVGAAFAERGFNDPALVDGADATGADAIGAGTNTTIGVVVTNAKLDKVGCQLLAQSAHDGLARSIWPVHSTVDGDAIVAVSVPLLALLEDGSQTAPVVSAHIDLVRMLAVEVTARAVAKAVSSAD